MKFRQKTLSAGRVGLAGLLAIATLPLVILYPSGVANALPAPVFTMFVPFEDQHVSSGLLSLNANGTNGDVVSTIAMTAAANDSIMYWDHWEDGYEADIANPVQTTTEVWGDNNGANGTTPGGATDDVDAGTVIFLQNTTPLPRVATDIRYDGRDKVASTRGFALTRAGWDDGLGTVSAGAVAATDLSKYGTQFDVPVGENMGIAAFNYTGVGIMASDDTTLVEIDLDGDGDIDDTQTLDEGEAYYVDGGVNAGATIQTSKPSQVHIITGERNAQWEGRWFEIFPEEIRGDEYIAAAGTTDATVFVTVFVYNPNDATIAVAVDAEGTVDDTNINVTPGATVAYNLPNGSGARFSSPGNPFIAVSGTVANSGSSNVYDWGYSLVPTASLTPGVVVGWADGSPGGTANYSPLWIAPLEDTVIYVDFDADGTPDDIGSGTFDDDNDPGTPAVFGRALTAFESTNVGDPDFDATGARVYTTDGTLISVAWGQDPGTGEPSAAYDLGTAVLPSTALVTTKKAELVVDVNLDGQVNPGDTLEYTIRSVDAGALSLTNLVVLDTLPSTLTYVPGTTEIDGVPLADDGSGATVFPVDETGITIPVLDPGAAVEISFRTQLVDPFPPFVQQIRNNVTVDSDQANSTATSIVPVVIPDLYIGKTAPTTPVLPGAQFDYDIEVSNVSVSAQTGIDITDVLPAEVSWVSTSVTRPIDDPTPAPVGSSSATENWDAALYTDNAAFWAGDWTEVDGGGAGPGAGNVAVVSELGDNRLRLTNNNSVISRTFDATDWNESLITFDYRRENLEAGDYATFEVSTTGGSSWIELDRFQGPGTDAAYLSTFYDLTRFVGQDLAIRFTTSSTLDNTDEFFFDDLTLSVNKRVLETIPGGAAPALYSGGELLMGESIVITLTVEVDGALDPTTDFFVNTATTSSTQNPSFVSSSAPVNVARAQVGDTVWHDLDGDGVIDAGEPLLSGVTVTLYDSGNTPIATALTGVDGVYNFGGTTTELDPGDYTVAVTAGLPAGMIPTYDADAASALAADGSAGVNLTFGEFDDSVDFGYALPVTLGDTVFADLDGNGVENGSDFGITGITVTITGPSHPTGTTDTTDGAGFYEFTNLLPGDYSVVVDTTPLSVGAYSTTGGDTQNVTLVSDTDLDTVDFGYVIPAAIGDFLWHDLDGDGVQDAGEPALAGVTVEITGPGIAGTETRVTDANGYYLFTNLDAGTFDVTVVVGSGDLPAGYVSSTGGATRSVTVAADDVVDTADFGFYDPVTIGDFVFEDVDGDGIFNGVDVGIDGVDVTITGTSPGASHPGGLTQSTVNGAYDFTGLAPGTYTVVVDESGFAAGTISTLDGASPSITVVSGDDENDADFGYVFPATFGDKVFHDLNANNVQDAGEPGINGVELTLVDDATGDPVGTVTTSGDGDYVFSTLPIGDYTVTLDVATLPAGYAITDGVNTDGASLPTSASSYLDADFGLHTTADLGDTIFHDLNNDGDQDPGEPGLVGVEVTLTGTDAGGAPIVIATPTQSTGAGGQYLFTDLDPGTYVVTVNPATLPSGYAVTAGDDTRTTVLVSNTDDLTLDFGYATTGSLGDYIWDDLNGDGVQNDGPAASVGFDGVTVTLTGVRSNGTTIPAQTTDTDANGAYLFDNLEPGTYTATVDTNDLPAGSVSTTGGSASTATIDSDEDDGTVDFGYAVGASIGDFIYVDSDADGDDTGETGIDGVTVTLTQGATTIGTTTTVNGAYSFDALPPGTYTVTVTSTDLPDGGVGQVGATSQVVTITSGNTADSFDIDTDFGFYGLVDLGDFVFEDFDGDGVQDVGDTGIDGVTIELLQGAVVIDTTDTVDGSYLFTDLLPGDYTVRLDTSDLAANAVITAPAGSNVAATTLTSGNDDLSLDFGIVNPISIGDFLYEDLDADGSPDAGEPGLDGLDVTITGTSAGASHAAGLTIQTTNGDYLFDDLLPGTYVVTVDGTQTGGYSATTTTLRAGTFSSGDSTDQFDFGYARPAAVGDKIFEDLNGNGVDDGEPGLAGVELTLSGPGVPVGAGAPTVVTDGSGSYSFTGLTADPAAYTVTVTDVPAGYTNTLGGTDQSAVLGSNETDNTLDFGYYFGAAIGDTVYDDLNGDGDQDAGEPGFSGVVVQLDDGNLLTPVLTDTTDANGAYQFTGLEPGTYTVSIQSGLPAGVVNTEGGASQTFIVTSGETVVDGDFGYYRPGSIGDFLFEDSDGDGTQNEGAANGISGVTLTLTGVDSGGNTIPTQTTESIADGVYAFSGLQPGDYTVTVDSTDPDLAGRTISTTGGLALTQAITSGVDVESVDFGVVAPVRIGDYVYADNDGSASVTAGDVALDGVTVTLTGTDGQGNAIAAQVDTTVAGLYEFTGLLPGEYTVTVSPTGDLDGDEFSTTGGSAQTVTAASGDDIDTVDFGYAEPASIGDTLYVDTNGNGTQDVGEPGIPDITVVVTGPSYPSGSGTTFVTGPTGQYTASTLSAGDYTITVDTADPDFDADFRSNTGGSSTTRTLAIGQSIVDADFGYIVPVTIGDIVFLDDNGDGLQAGDSGVGGVQVELTGGDLGAPLTTTTAFFAGPNGPIGSYAFDGLTPGDYTVTITGGLPANSLITTTGGATQSSTTTSGVDDLARDFGVAVRGAIGDLVYEDSNADGTQFDVFGGAEVAYADGTITITGPSHPTGVAVTTAADGSYLLGNLDPGTYTVSIAVPATDTVIEGTAGYTIDIASGETSTVADFGVVRPATIGDVVYEDLNGNGIQDAGEPGLDGVELTLGGDAAATTTTATLGGVAGSYVFTALQPGDYTVDVTAGLPAGAVLLEGDSGQARSIESGDAVGDADFGFAIPVAIGDYVWDDLDGNGLKDDGTPAARGLSGVELTLVDGDALRVDPTVTTDANGFYEFTGVLPGSYDVEITNGLGANDTITSSGGTIPGTGTVSIVVVSATDVDTVDFGIALPADLGDLVFSDIDGNGIFDGADTGIASLPMTITGTSAGASFPGGTTVTTDAAGPTQGDYALGNLLPGTYSVVIDIADLPAGATPTTVGVVRDVAGGTDTLTTSLQSGASDLALDFGYSLPASIGDQLFVDNNANGVFDAGDDPIANVDVTLTGPGFPAGTTIATDVDGRYNFTDLTPGDFTVELDVDDPQFDAVFPAGSEIASAGPAVRNVTIASSDVRSDVDFGFYALGSIGDLVFEDANADADSTGDTGIDAVTVTLDDGNGATPVVTVDTVNGAYVFTDLVPGTYTVTVTVPGMVATTLGAANGTIQTVTIGSGEDDLDADFGFITPIAVGDTIFSDLDGNGIQNGLESGLFGVTVTLSGGDLVADLIDVTDSNGDYGFSGLTPGDYTVSVDRDDLPSTASAVTTPITAVVAGDDTIDVTLTSGNDDLTIDFGYAAPVLLGDLVFEDLNGNGAFDAGEPGINGVTVELSGGALVAPITTTTATVGGIAGTYDFVDVAPSDTAYMITIVDPAAGVLVGATNTFGGTSQTFSVVSGSDDLSRDFGFTYPAAIGDIVFVDADGNGNYNPAIDTLLDGVTVTLDDGNVATPAVTVVTGSGAFGPGEYGFVGLAPGTYTATVTDGAPAGATIDPITVTLTSGESNLDVDFPIVENVVIGDFVWHDLDNDGVQDAGEPGLDGVDVQLRNTVTNAVITETTNGAGFYQFTDVAPGEYAVEILVGDRPADFVPATGNTESQAYTVTSGNSITTADFNYRTTATIGDFVWDDQDGDNVQDAGEPGINGVQVQLVGEGVTLNTTTDGAGNYSFTGLEPGDYVITFGVPTGATPTSVGGDVVNVTVLSGETDNDVDLGLAYGASIGDRVFHDLDADGVQTVGTEPGLGGVEVQLDGPGGTRSATTDGNGDYLFTGLLPGTYTVTVNNVTVPAGAISGAQLTTTTHVGGPVEFVRTVASGDAATDADFGYATTAVIGDTVFEDENGNGVQDGVEPGIVGITLELVTGPAGAEVVVATAVTQADGTYQFTGVAPGDYTVRAEQASLPAGLSPTSPEDIAISVLSDERDLSADFGFARPSIVGDFVWHDLDNDGIQDAGEPGLENVSIELVDANNPDPLTNVVATAVTDANGVYELAGIAPGDYIVRVDMATAPTGVNSGLPMVASDGVPTSNPITIESGDSITDQDFGFRTVAAIGDMVWHDLDADGVENDGAPTDAWLDAVLVELVDAATDTVVQTQTTVDGSYGFTNVDPGTYEVRVSNLPAGYSSTTGNNPLTLTVGSDDVVVDADFGFAQLTGGSIGDEIFDDLNGNGVRDAGEPGLVVDVELFLNTGTVAAPIWTSQGTRTTTGGGYVFANLAPGSYEVRVDPANVPAGYAPTTAGDLVQGTTITSGATDLDLDFGFVAAATLGDLVWHDLDSNATSDDGTRSEVGLANVLIEARTLAGDVVASQTTDANGTYSMTLPPGTYDIVVVPATFPVAPNTGVTMELTTVSTRRITLQSNENRTDAMFGLVAPATIGDTIFDDLDGDGTQDPGEPGLPSVTVVLDDGDPLTPPVTASTDVDGNYEFSVPVGDYTVAVDPTTLPVGYQPTTSVDPVDVSVTSDEVRDDVDLGYVTPGSISGVIFTDGNADGDQTGEASLDGVTVELLDDNGLVIDTVVTGTDGAYTFTGLLPGDFTVRPILPAGAILTTPNNTGDDTTDSDVLPATGQSQVITMTSGAAITDVDAGVYQPATLGDTVFADLDGDGTQSVDEPGLPGIPVTVLDLDGMVVGSAVTDADGSYTVSVVPGTLTVSIATPTGYRVDPGGDTQGVSIASGETNLDVDFPVVGSGSLSGTLVYDVASDGTINPTDPGLSGVLVTATWQGPNGPVVRSTVTDTDGTYTFTSLPPGDWTVTIDPADLPNGIIDPTIDPDGVNDLTNVVPVSGGAVTNIDFGVSGTANLGDNVFLDLNGNGEIDPGEPGVEGVRVTTVVATVAGPITFVAVTDANGRYEFTKLPAGDYTVNLDVASLPAELEATDPVKTTTLVINGSDLSLDLPVVLRPGPKAAPDVRTTPVGVPVLITIDDNDLVAPGTRVEVVSSSTPSNGIATINPDGTILYTPNPGFVGTDTFEYTICDVDSLARAGDTAAMRALFCSTTTVSVTTPPAAVQPPVTPPATPVTPATPTVRSTPRTGSNTGPIQTVALSLLIAGLFLLTASRRRRNDELA